VVANRGVNLGDQGTYEELVESLDEIMDMSNAAPLEELGNIGPLGSDK
jgi:hypothetical protein